MAYDPLSSISKITILTGNENIVLTQGNTQTGNGRYPLEQLKKELANKSLLGSATPLTEDIEQGVYIAREAGVYPNFGNIEVTQADFDNGLVLLTKNNDGTFSKDLIPMPGVVLESQINVEGGVTGFNPIGEVKEGDSRAVSGGEVFEVINSINEVLGIFEIPKGTELISELIGSDKNDTNLWGIGYFWQDGQVRNDSANDWRYTVNYYDVLRGDYDVHLTVSGNSCVIFYDSEKNVVGFYKNQTSPTQYTFILNVYFPTARYFRFAQNFTAENTTDLLKFVSRDRYYTTYSTGVDSYYKEWFLNKNTEPNFDFEKIGSIYKIPLKIENGLARIKFDFKINEDINILDGVKPFFMIENLENKFKAVIDTRAAIVATDTWGGGFAATPSQCIRSNSRFSVSYNGGTATALPFTPSKKNTFGNFLFGIRYNEEVANTVANRDVCLSISDTLFRIYKKTTNTTLYEKVITTNTTVNDLYVELKALSFLDCYVNTTETKLAKDLIKINEIALSSSGYLMENKTTRVEYWDSGICWIAEAISNNWNRAEIVLENGNIYFAYNGETIECLSSVNYADENTVLYIGGEVGNASNLKVDVKNFHININYLADAEIVNYSLNYPILATKLYSRKLISNYNPALYIGVGHEVFPNDSSAVLEDTIDVTSDRLSLMFETFYKKGYTPINLHDVVLWKKGEIELPKRCYVPIFDDYRWNIFLNPRVRQLFERYDVKGAFAVITDRAFDVNFTNQPKWHGVDLDPMQFWRQVNMEGWHAHSHTRDHVDDTGFLRFRKTSEMLLEIEKDAVSAMKAGCRTDVMTYPQGQTRATCMYQLANSPFQIALLTANSAASEGGNNLPTMNSNDFYMFRFEMGRRNLTENLLASII